MKGWLSSAKKEEADEDAMMAQLKSEDGEDRKPSERILVLIGTYSVGKERIVKGIARAIGSKVYCTDYKRKIFECIDDPDLHAMLTRDPQDAQVHVTNLFAITQETLNNYLDSFKGYFTRIVRRPHLFGPKVISDNTRRSACDLRAGPLGKRTPTRCLRSQRSSRRRFIAITRPPISTLSATRRTDVRRMACHIASIPGALSFVHLVVAIWTDSPQLPRASALLRPLCLCTFVLHAHRPASASLSTALASSPRSTSTLMRAERR